MSSVEDRLRQALAAGPRDAAELGREAMGITGPDAVLAKVVDAILTAAGWAERIEGRWRLRPVPPAPPELPEILLVAVGSGDRGAIAPWRDGKLGEVRIVPAAETAAAVSGRPAVSFQAIPGTLNLRALCRELDPSRSFTSAARAAADWHLSHQAGEDATGALCILGAVWDHARALAAEQDLPGFEDLRALSERPRPALDLAPYRFDAQFLATLPETPGVYRFHDASGDVFYVGKAVNLRNRILSYFRVPRVPDPKWSSIVERLREIDFTILGSGLEALLVERRLIGELRERLINVQAEAYPRPPRRLPDRSVFVLPSASDAHAALWLHIRGVAIRKLEARLDPRGVRGVADQVRSFFNARRDSDPGDLAIAEGWLGDNIEKVPRLDPDRPDFEELLARHLRGDAFQPVTYR